MKNISLIFVIAFIASIIALAATCCPVFWIIAIVAAASLVLSINIKEKAY